MALTPPAVVSTRASALFPSFHELCCGMRWLAAPCCRHATRFFGVMLVVGVLHLPRLAAVLSLQCGCVAHLVLLNLSHVMRQLTLCHPVPDVREGGYR